MLQENKTTAKVINVVSQPIARWPVTLPKHNRLIASKIKSFITPPVNELTNR